MTSTVVHKQRQLNVDEATETCQDPDMFLSLHQHSKLCIHTYRLQLSRLKEWGPSRLLCKLCAGHLREACAFRKQVADAETCFVQFNMEREKILTDPETAIKSECEAEEDYLSTTSPEAIAKQQFNSLPKVKIKSEKDSQCSKRKKLKKAKKTPKSRSTIDNADTPCAESKTMADEASNNPISVDFKFDYMKDTKATDPAADITVQLERDKTGVANVYADQKLAKSQAVKQISERKRLMSTCYTVLKYTSACPFRHHKSWFQCFYCLQEFMEINLLRHHTTQTHASVEDELKKIKRFPRSLQIDISELKCLECSLTLASVEIMRDHLSQKHDEIIYKECIADYKVDASPFKCHLCLQEFHVFRTLTVHLNDHYANCICDVCGKPFINSKRLKVHKRTHESGLFPCPECDKVLNTKTSRANHIENSHSKRVLKCHICLKTMKHYNDRIKHMSDVHHVTHTFKCPMCPKEYNIKHYLATHVRQTHGSKNKKCPECNMAFITNHALKKHMLKHTGEKPFTCSTCGKTYARSYTLKEHMRAHDGGRKV